MKKLVEAMARDWWERNNPTSWSNAYPDQRVKVLTDMTAVLAAIDAATDEHGNRIAWVAPWKATDAMIDAACAADPGPKLGADTSTVDWVKAEWDAHRDACIAERRGEGR
jgi:hypothetical protein